MNLAFPLPARGTVLPNPNGEIPISRYIGNPAHPNDEWERVIRVGYEFDHRFNESIGLIQNFRYFWLDWTSNNLSYPQALSEDGRFLTLAGLNSATSLAHMMSSTFFQEPHSTSWEVLPSSSSSKRTFQNRRTRQRQNLVISRTVRSEEIRAVDGQSVSRRPIPGRIIHARLRMV